MSRREGTHPVEGLSAFLDGEAGERERRGIEAHLELCAECRERLDDWRLLDGALAAETAPAVPEELAARIRERLDAPAAWSFARAAFRAARRGARWDRGVPLAAAASLLVAVLWLLGHGLRRPEPPNPPSAAPAMAPATAQVTTPVDPFTGRKPVPTPAPQARPLGALRRDTPVRRVSPPPPAGDRTRPVEARAPATPPILEPRTFARADAKEEGDVVSAQALDLSVREQGPTALEAPPYRVRLLTDARMSVETSGFACLVPVSQEDARSLAAIAFEARVRREKRVEAAQTLQAAPSEAVTAPAAAPRVALAAPRVCADLSAEDCRFILSLVRERYRLAIEERCGPPPR